MPEENMSAIREALSKKKISSSNKILLILSIHGSPMSPAKILEFGVNNGARNLAHVPQLLVGLGDKVIRLPTGWTISAEGKNRLQKLGLVGGTELSSLAQKLSSVAKRINSPDTVSFIDEAIGCIEKGYYRSAIILSWIGAFSLIQSHIVKNCLVDFNTEAVSKNKAKKAMASESDISELMKEFDVINVAHSIGAISRNLRDQLHTGLKLRNAAGHPNDFQFGEAMVAGHVEALLLNVYLKY